MLSHTRTLEITRNTLCGVLGGVALSAFIELHDEAIVIITDID